MPVPAGRVPGWSSARPSICTPTATPTTSWTPSRYDQFAIRGMLGDDAKYLLENTDVFVSTYEGEVLGVDLPLTVDLRVTQTDPGFAGDTATGAKKQATVETGLVVSGAAVRERGRCAAYLAHPKRRVRHPDPVGLDGRPAVAVGPAARGRRGAATG